MEGKPTLESLDRDRHLIAAPRAGSRSSHDVLILATLSVAILAHPVRIEHGHAHRSAAIPSRGLPVSAIARRSAVRSSLE
jgi:hypothetical protein